MTALRTVMNSKIHRATVTEADVNYIGSITIDSDLIDAANIVEWEKIEVLNITNGSRLQTYVIRGQKGSGEICINGAAAHLVHPGDLVILVTYKSIEEQDLEGHSPNIIHVNSLNQIIENH
jgi:aspartate 1-decarboxylase